MLQETPCAESAPDSLATPAGGSQGFATGGKTRSMGALCRMGEAIARAFVAAGLALFFITAHQVPDEAGADL